MKPRKKKRKATDDRKMSADHNHDTDDRIRRLKSKLNKIRSDILFDEDEADRRWADIHFDLAKDTAARKKFEISNGSEPESVMSCTADTSVTAKQDSDDSGLLGELFFGLPDVTTELATGVSSLTVTDTGSEAIEIRDFGKWTGISPRRVFEEACRAR